MSAPPATFGHQVTAGQTVYIEVANEDSGGVPGPFTLAWELRTLLQYDCIGGTFQVGDPVPGEDPETDIERFTYVQDAAGNHWIAWVTNSGSVLKVARGDPTATSWTTWTVNTPPVAFTGGPLNIATDGTHVWVAAGQRSFSPTDHIDIVVFEYGGGSWPLITTIPGTPSNTSFISVATFTLTDLWASAADPGVAYLIFCDSDGATPTRRVVKVDTASLLWESDDSAVGQPFVTNESGSPLLFFVAWNAGGTRVTPGDVDFYSINASSGALTLLQSVTYAELGQGSSGTPQVLAYNISRIPYVDPTDGATVYYVAVTWSNFAVSRNYNLYRVRADGSTDFEWFKLTAGDALVPYFINTPIPAGIWQDSVNGGNTWIPEVFDTMAHFTELCAGNGWEVNHALSEFDWFGSNLKLVGDDFYFATLLPQSGGPDVSLVVARQHINRHGCNCPLLGGLLSIGRFYATLV